MPWVLPKCIALPLGGSRGAGGHASLMGEPPWPGWLPLGRMSSSARPSTRGTSSSSRPCCGAEDCCGKTSQGGGPTAGWTS